MSLIKSARGLPRFMADCGFWRHPKWKGSDLAQIGLFTACLSYCYEHETDGDLPGPDAEDLACALGLKPRHVKPALAALIARGSLLGHDDRIEIVDFASHNPTSSEIREHREKRSAAGKKAADARWSHNESQSESDANRITGRNASVEESREGNSSSFDAGFEDWWSGWPKKVDKAEARAKYVARRRAGATHVELVKARDNYVRTVEDVRYCKHGGTFLAPETWKEWLEPPKTNGTRRVDFDKLAKA